MNKGWSLDEILHAVELPTDLMEKPYLRPVYDDPNFLIRMVWRRYGGWWDGEFDTLLPARKAEQGAEWIALAGGVKPVLERARVLGERGRHALACHLVEAAYHAAPDDAEVHEVRVQAYRANSQAQTSSMARNILHHASLASEKRRRDLASSD
jgi:alkyl sulfatase BDS1-like metallo-beta-lactamase superfamily hydrolase